MKVLFLSEKEDAKEDITKKIEDALRNLLSKSNIDNVLKAKKSAVLNSRYKYNVYVILSDDIDYILKISSKIDSRNRIVILTNNLSKKHILECIKITPNVCHIQNEIDRIARKILSIYLYLDVMNEN